MTLKIGFQKTLPSGIDTLIAAVYAGNRLTPSAEKLDLSWGGIIRHQLKSQKKFTGKAGQMMTVTAPKNSKIARLVLIGLDAPAALDAQACEMAGGRVYAAISASGFSRAALFADDEKARGKLSTPEMAAHLAMGALLRSYRFEKYKSRRKEGAAGPESLTVITGPLARARAVFDPLEKAARGVFLARDLANEPPNILYPESFARIIRRELAPLGVSVQVIDHRQMEKMGFGAHLAVGQGSARPPRVVVMHWRGGKKSKKAPLAFVGKGVTFDTGGISIKPSAGMDDMKHDMGGAAAVVGLMKTLALRKAKTDVIGIVGLAENMPSDRAYRPGDIIRSLSGKTIEVLNTDAEGRLVLADSLTHVQRAFKPRIVVNLATLTGAIVVALGHEYAGAFANDETLWKNLEQADRASGERLWRMPLGKSFMKDVESHVADLKNIAGADRGAGSCVGAGFLQHFINEGQPWAHLDIAGMAWTKADKPTCPRTGTGFGVRLLDRLIADHYE